MSVVVPPSGPPAALLARPTLVRLEDRAQGTFALRLDNRAANHPRRYRMSASDPEGVVVLDFVPSAVDVPAGETSDVMVRFAAPEPPPGKEAARRLTVTATDEDGPVTVQVTIVQATRRRPAAARSSATRAEPGHLGRRDDRTAWTSSSTTAAVTTTSWSALRGRDPANAISFAFDHDGFPLPAGGRWARDAARGGSATAGRIGDPPFTSCASAGEPEAEISGAFELTSRPASIATARVRLAPRPPRRLLTTGQLRSRTRQPRRGAPAFGGRAVRFGRVRDGWVQVLTSHVAVPPGQVGRRRWSWSTRSPPAAPRRPDASGSRQRPEPAPSKARPSSPRSRTAIDGCGPSSWS